VGIPGKWCGADMLAHCVRRQLASQSREPGSCVSYALNSRASRELAANRSNLLGAECVRTVICL